MFRYWNVVAAPEIESVRHPLPVYVLEYFRKVQRHRESYAVVIDGETSIRDFFTVFELGGSEVNIVGLPGERRERHIDDRLRCLIEAAAFVVFSFEAKGVENLAFVAVVDIDTAVRSRLALAVWHKAREEFDVHLIGSAFKRFGLGFGPEVTCFLVDLGACLEIVRLVPSKTTNAPSGAFRRGWGSSVRV